MHSQPHDMILGKMKQCGAQANAARCNGLRSVLQRATQRTAFVASPFCRARSFRYAKTIHPARCIRPFTFERPRSRVPKSRKRLKGARHCIADLTEAHRSGMSTDLGQRRKEYHPFSPSKHPRSSRQRASSPAESPKDAVGRMIGPEELFLHVLGSQ